LAASFRASYHPQTTATITTTTTHRLPHRETVNYETEVPLSNLWRYRLNPQSRSYTSKEVFSTYCDFPSIPAVRAVLSPPYYACACSPSDPTITHSYLYTPPPPKPPNPPQAKTGQPYRYTYLAAGRDPTYPTPVGVVAKFDVEAGALVDSWQAAPHEFISEAVVVPRAGAKEKEKERERGGEEDDCYLMVMLFDGKTSLSQLLIFDAKAVGKGAWLLLLLLLLLLVVLCCVVRPKSTTKRGWRRRIIESGHEPPLPH
jgi:carotenoid cleavage dioxygenase-like enzyme